MLRAPFALVWNLLKLLSFALKTFFFRLGHFLTRKRRKWVRLKLPRRFLIGPPTGLAQYFQDTPSYLELRDIVETIADDERIEGVVIVADHVMLGGGRTADLRALLERLRQSGKSIIFHSHTVMGRQYDLAVAADQVVMTPGGRFYYFGHRFEQFFAGALLDRLGVAAQFVHIGPFKGAAHRFFKSEATPPLRLMMEQMVEGLSELREERIATRRGITAPTMSRAFERMPLDDRQAEAMGLIDGRIHRRFLRRWIEEGPDFVDTPAFPRRDDDEKDKLEGEGKKGEEKNEKRQAVSLKDATDYAEASPTYNWTPLFRRPRVIAVVDLSGMIVMPNMEIPGHSAATIDPSEVLPVLRQLASNRRVASVLLHINSPGGSALASEMVWDGIRRLRCEKPTVAYCSDVAGSGGYYLAVGADQIVCHQETIMGSIGVIAGKFSFPGTLERFDITAEAFARHETSQFESLAQPLSEQVLDNLQRDARSFYRQFLRRVGDARKIPRRRLHRYARGRIYTGADAHRRHLVDHLGNFDDALEILRSLSDPALPKDTTVQFAPHRKISLGALIRQSAKSPSFWTGAVGDLKLVHALAKRDPLLALMPFQLEQKS